QSGDGQNSFLLQFLDRGRVGPVLIYVDDPCGLMFGGLEHLAEEPFGGPRVSFRAEHEVNRLSRRIDGAVKILPLTFDFDVGLINSVGVVGQSQVRTDSFLQLWSISLNPPVNGRVIV